MLSLYLKAIGLIAPGMNSWKEAHQVLIQPDQYQPVAIARKLDTLLPANERRRAARVTQLALYAAQQTGTDDFSQCLTVFSSSNGDVSTFHQISQALTMAGRPVSPTRFHNSVHNAPSGYWSIATQSQTPSTSLTAYTDSFVAGLLEAAVQLNASDNQQHRDCLLVCYDECPPAPFEPLITITEEFSCALRFSHSDNNNHSINSTYANEANLIARLDIALSPEPSPVNTMSDTRLEKLRLSNPQARILPLLDAIAHQRHETIRLPYFEQALEITITPVAKA